MPGRKTTLRPVGQVTQPNQFGYYVDGALDHAINCVMRDPGVLSAAPSMFSSSSVSSAGDTLRIIAPMDSGHAYECSVSAGNVWTVTEGGGNPLNTIPFSSTTGTFSNTGRTSFARAKDRMLLNSNYGVLVGDNMAPVTIANRNLRPAGLPQLTMMSVTATSATGGPIPAIPSVQGILMFGYVGIHTRTFSDGYKLVSVPTPVVKLFAASGSARYFTVQLGWAPTGVAAVGDVIELYRTDGFLTSSINSEPPAVYKLVGSYTLTATEIAQAFVNIVDNSKMGDAPYYSTTGRELYCNPGQGGLTTINRQPPVSACIAQYDGRVFYGNTQDRPRMTVAIPAGIGSTNNIAQASDYWRVNGIGTRTVPSLTATSGSPTITGFTASTILGIKPGQLISPSAVFTNPAYVQSVNTGAGTVTMTSNATTNASGLFAFADVLWIGFNNGTLYPYRIADNGDLLLSMGGVGVIPGSPYNVFEITTNTAFFGGVAGGTNYGGAFNPAISLTIEARNYGAAYQSMQVMATNGANYAPQLAEYTASPTPSTVTQFARTPLKNFLTWSKDQQPEHVPPGDTQVNSSFVGLREIIAMVSTEAALWIACLDGLYRLSGTGGQYRLDTIDSTKIICGPQCMTAMNEQVFVYTNYGMYQIDSETRTNLTDQVIGDLLVGPEYSETPNRILCSNEQDLEILYVESPSLSKIWVYATREGGGWTTLENNTASLSNVSALVYQRSPASGDPRVLVGVSPGGGTQPSYAGWGNTASWLTMNFEYQPWYGEDPLTLKQWIEASFIWASNNAGKSMRPRWNQTPVGSASIVLYQNGAYARAGVPRAHGQAQSISVGCDSVTNTGVQPRSFGVSVVYSEFSNQAKQRGG